MIQEHERGAGSWHSEWRPLTELLTVTGSAASWLRTSWKPSRSTRTRCAPESKATPAPHPRNLSTSPGAPMIPYHRVTGPEDAPVLVLSNSLGATLQMWDPQAKALARTFRLVRYDTRGHGKSDTPPGRTRSRRRPRRDRPARRPRGRARALRRPLARRDDRPVARINAPERIDKLVLLATSPKMGPPEMWWTARSPCASGHRGDLDGTFERWFTEAYRAEHDLSEWREMFVDVPDEGYASCCSIIEQMDLTDGLPHMTRPRWSSAARRTRRRRRRTTRR